MVTTRTPLMAGNWKMNLDHLQAIAFTQKLAWALKDAKHDYDDVEVAIFLLTRTFVVCRRSWMPTSSR